jgi:hypothetical protein
MKKIIGAYVLGMLTVLGFAYSAGADALLTLGAKWQAAQRTYVVYSEPAREMDESLVGALLTENTPAVRPVKRGGARQK